LKYLPLLWSEVWRRPFRTALTFLSIGTAFVLFGLLHGVTATFDGVIDLMPANRLKVLHAEMRTPLPIGYLDKISQLEGVTNVTAVSYVQGYFGEARNWTNAAAWSNAQGLFGSSDVQLDKAFAEAFDKNRMGAIADRSLAQRYGWNIGDLIPMTSLWRQQNGSNVWTFELVGLYDAPPNSLLADQFWIHFQYFDEARVLNKGTADSLIAHTDDPRRNAEIGEAIDALFENSSSPTSTMSEREMLRAGMEQAMDFNLLVKLVLGGSFFTLLLVTASTMMESVRERITELAVLKALGYGNTIISSLVLAEALFVYLLGGAFGLCVAKSFYPLIAPRTPGAGSAIPLPWEVIAQGAVIVVLASVASGIAPALRAQRLSVVDALRRG
jgi:putative ABC transport system permease protein